MSDLNVKLCRVLQISFVFGLEINFDLLQARDELKRQELEAKRLQKLDQLSEQIDDVSFSHSDPTLSSFCLPLSIYSNRL